MQKKIETQKCPNCGTLFLMENCHDCPSFRVELCYCEKCINKYDDYNETCGQELEVKQVVKPSVAFVFR